MIMTLEELDKHVTEKLVPYVVSQYNTTTKVVATPEQLFSDLISAVGKTNAQEALKKSCRIEFPYSTKPCSQNHTQGSWRLGSTVFLYSQYFLQNRVCILCAVLTFECEEETKNLFELRKGGGGGRVAMFFP